MLLSRIENRSNLQQIAEAGIKKAIAALKYDFRLPEKRFSAYSKNYRYNNEQAFKQVQLHKGSFDVVYDYYDGTSAKPIKRYGIVDEERKLNINIADKTSLAVLL